MEAELRQSMEAVEAKEANVASPNEGATLVDSPFVVANQKLELQLLVEEEKQIAREVGDGRGSFYIGCLPRPSVDTCVRRVRSTGRNTIT
eukprot:SAG11_NODE_718_length_7584_cov_10.771009_4_plen_90_part_00